MRASCLFIRGPHVRGQAWSTCPNVSVRPQQSQRTLDKGLPLAALDVVATVVPQ